MDDAGQVIDDLSLVQLEIFYYLLQHQLGVFIVDGHAAATDLIACLVSMWSTGYGGNYCVFMV